MSKKIKITLIASLILNILLIGFIAGVTTRNAPPFERMRDRIRHETNELSKTLSPEKQQLLERSMHDLKTYHKQHFGKMKNAREALVAAITAPEFSESLYLKRVAEIEALDDQMHRKLAEVGLQLSKSFSQEERVRLAEHLRRATPPRPARKDDIPPPDSPPPPHD